MKQLGKEMIKMRVAFVLSLLISFPFYTFAEDNAPEEEEQSISIPERPKRVLTPKQGAKNSIFELDSLDVDEPQKPVTPTDSTTILSDSIAATMQAAALSADSIAADSIPKEFVARRSINLNPTRAVWLSALCPGLGQLYNRRYWKIPIVVGGFVGLTYATSWNNRMLDDYTKAYRDIMDSDPNTKSYLDFFPPNTKESDIDEAWLKKSLKSKKDFYRRNRDLCIIGMVGLYLVNIIDAYVDATLSHFDISPELSIDVAPAVLNNGDARNNSLGVQCALTF